MGEGEVKAKIIVDFKKITVYICLESENMEPTP
jgi:hypothetical protein